MCATRRYYLATSSCATYADGEVRRLLAALHYFRHFLRGFFLCAHYLCDNIKRKTDTKSSHSEAHVAVDLRRMVLTFNVTGEGHHQFFHRFGERF